MNTHQTNYRDFVPVLQFVFKYGITIDQIGTDMWKIRTTNTSAGNSVDNLDLTRTYPSFDLAVQAIVNTASGRTSAAA